MAQEDDAAGDGEVALGLEEESHGVAVAVAGDGAAAWRGLGEEQSPTSRVLGLGLLCIVFDCLGPVGVQASGSEAYCSFGP